MTYDCSKLIQDFLGTTLQGAKYKPMFGKAKGREDGFPLVPSGHVTNTAGTGLVHIAPCHGQQDFLLALEHKIPLVNLLKKSLYTVLILNLLISFNPSMNPWSILARHQLWCKD